MIAPRTKKLLAVAAVAVLLGSGIAAQLALLRHRPNASPAVAEGLLAALGGFRSLAAEAVWFRAEGLQEEGKFVELASLAEALAVLEPHTPEVWSFAAWNLAYNVSIMMPSEEDRWRWVDAAIRLLRDRGLALNPGEPELCEELAWLFQLKIGADLDTAAPIYRAKWKSMVDDVARRGAWRELGMDEGRMRAVELTAGTADWTNPLMSAVYFANLGLEKARGKERAMLAEIRRQSLVVLTAGPKR